jgi:hypothetical protein
VEKERREGEAEQGLPGHMQPLGSHVTPEYVKRVWGEILRGSEFVEQYVHPKQPVIFEGLIKNLTVRKNWANDNYLRYTRNKLSFNIGGGGIQSPPPPEAGCSPLRVATNHIRNI